MTWKSYFKTAFDATFVVACCVISFSMWGKTADDQATDASKSWTATTEPQVSVDMNPTRITETHTQSGNRIVDTQSVERLGPAGHFEPYFDIEKESIQVNATTIRTVVRTFGRDGAARTLHQVSEEVREELPGGGESVVRTVSIPELDGHLLILQREVTNTQRTSPDVQETKTTIFSSDGRGEFAASMQIRERQRRTDDHTVELQKTTLLLDGGGYWQVHELKESTIRENGKDRTTEERVSRPEYDGGKLSVVSDTIAKESETGPGERYTSVETYSTYSTDIPGWADGKRHLSQRVTTVRRPHSDEGQATEEAVEQPDRGDPSAGLQVTRRTVEIESTNHSGTLQTRTIEVPDFAGNLKVVSAETRKSNQPNSVRVETPTQGKL